MLTYLGTLGLILVAGCLLGAAGGLVLMTRRMPLAPRSFKVVVACSVLLYLGLAWLALAQAGMLP